MASDAAAASSGVATDTKHVGKSDTVTGTGAIVAATALEGPSGTATATDSQDASASRASGVAADLDRKGASSSWETTWSAGLKVGERFDTAAPCKALCKLLQQLLCSDKNAFVGKKALVPGCGRAYDAVALAAAGFDATGLDLAPTAVKSAQNWYTNLPDDHAYAGKLAGSVAFRCGNFFDEHKKHAGEYDLIFDCTFLCALHPDARANWCKQMAMLTKKGGELVTLIFPIGKSSPGGPPYPMTTALVTGLLGKWFECISMVDPLPKDLDHMGVNPWSATSALAHWRRR